MDNSATHDRDDQDETRAQDTHDNDQGTEDSDGAPAPFAPDADDDTPLGDTDEHSDA